jgi:hypothetical protein
LDNGRANEFQSACSMRHVHSLSLVNIVEANTRGSSLQTFVEEWWIA